MRCSEEKCGDQDEPGEFYPSIERADLQNGIPKCQKCGSNMKHHAMFFDEMYGERWYQYKTLWR
jgi:NAD-dependent SIR2 family protein deacetylase